MLITIRFMLTRGGETIMPDCFAQQIPFSILAFFIRIVVFFVGSVGSVGVVSPRDLIV